MFRGNVPKSRFNIAYKTNQTLKNFLDNLIDKSQSFEKSGIYEKNKKLKEMYNDPIRRAIRRRDSEHLDRLKYNGNEKSSVAHHILSSGYSVDESSFKLVRHVMDRTLFKAYETLVIIIGYNFKTVDNNM